MTEPHYLRFARSLALVSGLGCAAVGCGTSTTPGDDAGTTGTDAAVLADAGFDCTMCTCGGRIGDAGVRDCTGDEIVTCGCAAVGPLAPPDLAV